MELIAQILNALCVTKEYLVDAIIETAYFQLVKHSFEDSEREIAKIFSIDVWTMSACISLIFWII